MEQGVPAGGKDVVFTPAEGGLPPGPPYDCEARKI